MLRQAVVFCALLAIATAALQRAPLEPIPEKFKGQEGCYITDLDRVIPFSTTVPSESSCVEYSCYDSGVTIVSCGAVMASPPCVIEEDKSKLYPECCPMIVCP